MNLGHTLLTPRVAPSLPDDRSRTVPQDATPQPSASAAAAEITDRELVREFIRSRDQAAFQQIVTRHGGLVLGVASRVLRDRHLAEDVFQATFLVLARKAASVRKQTSLASWLHGVARRIALRALRLQCRRGEETLHNEPAMEVSPLESVGSQWEQQVLDEELQQLPETWREPLILHELEGLSCEATADRLGLTLTALEGRLKRGRKELKHRLLRRGIGVSAVLVGLQASQAAAACQPAANLILATVQASIDTTTAAATASAAAQPLTSSQQLAAQELIAMTTVKTTTLLGIAGILVLAAGLTGSGVRIASEAGAAGGPPYTVHLLAADDSADGATATQIASTPAANDKAANGSNPKQFRAELIRRLTLDLAGRVPTEAEIDRFVSDEREVDSLVGELVKRLQKDLDVAVEGDAESYLHLSDILVSRAASQSRIQEALSKRVDFEFIDTELRQVTEFLSDRFEIPVSIDASSLAEAGVDADSTVNLVVSGVTLESALNRIVRSLELDYVERDEMLEITTRAAAEEFHETRVYPLDNLPASFKPEDVARVICRTVRPGSWGENPWVYIVPTPAVGGEESPGSYGTELSGEGSSGYGGSPGTMESGESRKPVPADEPTAAIETLPGCLVVTHCQRAHREIVDLLDQLRQMPAAPKAATIPGPLNTPSDDAPSSGLYRPLPNGATPTASPAKSSDRSI